MRRTSSFRTPSFSVWLGRVLLLLLWTAGLLSGGFLLLCATGVLSPVQISQSVSAWLNPAAETADAAPTAGSASLPAETPPFRGVRLALEDLDQAETLAAGYDGVVVTMKASDGGLNYVSDLPLAADCGASSGDPNRNQALKNLNQTQGLYTVAQVSCLRDEALVEYDPGLALQRVSGSPWRDETGVSWLDPADAQVQGYLIGVCRELAQLGFDEILLTDCSFPTQGALDCLRPQGKKAEVLEAFCRQLQGALADFPVVLSVEGQGDWASAQGESGQTAGLLATFGRVWTREEDAEALTSFAPSQLP